MTSVAQTRVVSIEAGGDLSTLQFRFVKMSGAKLVAITSVTDIPFGVLQEGVVSGRMAEVVIYGPTKLVADAAIVAGVQIGPSADGQAETKIVGVDVTEYIAGMALGAASGVGMIFESFVNCVNPAPVAKSIKVIVEAGADLSLLQYHFVKFDTGKLVAIAAVTDVPAGVLQVGVASGVMAEIVVSGPTLVQSDAAIAIGAHIGPSVDGQAETKVAGADATEYIAGTALEAASGAGEDIDAVVNCVTPALAVAKATKIIAEAGADLSALQYHFVKFDTGKLIGIAAVTDVPAGVLQVGVASGVMAEIVVAGPTLVQSDAAITIGALIGTSIDGQADPLTIGTDTTVYIAGTALEAASGAGENIAAVVNCMSPARAA